MANETRKERVGGPLTAAYLAAAPPRAQKGILGRHLYPAVLELHPEDAARITGKMLEKDNSELLLLLKYDRQLKRVAGETSRDLQKAGAAEVLHAWPHDAREERSRTKGPLSRERTRNPPSEGEAVPRRLRRRAAQALGDPGPGASKVGYAEEGNPLGDTEASLA
eukprot:7558-Heterocapsa_arctica.AAC.1